MLARSWLNRTVSANCNSVATSSPIGSTLRLYLRKKERKKDGLQEHVEEWVGLDLTFLTNKDVLVPRGCYGSNDSRGSQQEDADQEAIHHAECVLCPQSCQTLIVR